MNSPKKQPFLPFKNEPDHAEKRAAETVRERLKEVEKSPETLAVDCQVILGFSFFPGVKQAIHNALADYTGGQTGDRLNVRLTGSSMVDIGRQQYELIQAIKKVAANLEVRMDSDGNIVVRKGREDDPRQALGY